MADEPDAISTSAISGIVTGLAEQGWISIPGFLSPAQLTALRSHCNEAYQQGGFRPASIGSGDTNLINANIRGDQIFWLEQSQAGVVEAFRQFTETLRVVLNQHLFLGAFESELHFARYPTGAAYKKHIDNFQGRSPRLVTLILYLNDDWQAEQGGQLRLYTGSVEGAGVHTDILPEGGKLVVFLSEQFYHEVLPANRERLSLTGWLRRRE